VSTATACKTGDPGTVWQRIETHRTGNGLKDIDAMPADAITAYGGGLGIPASGASMHWNQTRRWTQ